MNILVFRFSALGDVAISVPVINSLLKQNKDIKIYIATRPVFRDLFPDNPNIIFIDIDLKNRHKGICGLLRLTREIKKQYKIDYIVDIHNVLRTKILRIFMFPIKSSIIDKGRKEKHKATRRKNKILKPLKTSAQRYADTFRKIGLKLELEPYIYHYKPNSQTIEFIQTLKENLIGIAPFASNLQKMYPLDKMLQIVQYLSYKYNVLIFGGGTKEKDIAEDWDNKFDNVYSVVGRFSIKDDLYLMSKCKILLTMDSGNMHLAALVRTKIISIWGATHPFLGFTPYSDSAIYIQRDDLECRPCSVFGNKQCYRGDIACFNIEPQKIINIIETIIRK